MRKRILSGLSKLFTLFLVLVAVAFVANGVRDLCVNGVFNQVWLPSQRPTQPAVEIRKVFGSPKAPSSISSQTHIREVRTMPAGRYEVFWQHGSPKYGLVVGVCPNGGFYDEKDKTDFRVSFPLIDELREEIAGRAHIMSFSVTPDPHNKFGAIVVLDEALPRGECGEKRLSLPGLEPGSGGTAEVYIGPPDYHMTLSW